MSRDPSLLPEELRQNEEELKKLSPPTPEASERLKMSIPRPDDEGVEVIEVDEGDMGDVLEGEPLLSRVLFNVQSLFEEAKGFFFQPKQIEPPAKLPPQFFKAPPASGAKKKVPGLVPIPGVTPTAAPAISSVPQPQAPTPVPAKPRIIPAAHAPRRVRVIRRVRKPVRVSFLDEASVQAGVDLPRRRFTLVVTALMFMCLLGGGYALMVWQGGQASANLTDVNSQLQAVATQTQTQQAQWERYRDLEPRLRALVGLLDRHLSPSKVFEALEFNTLATVSYSSFTLSPDGRVVLSTVAPSFEAAAEQVAAFQRSGVATKVEAMGYQAKYRPDSGALDQVNFQIALSLDPRVLRAAEPLPVSPVQ